MATAVMAPVACGTSGRDAYAAWRAPRRLAEANEQLGGVAEAVAVAKPDVGAPAAPSEYPIRRDGQVAEVRETSSQNQVECAAAAPKAAESYFGKRARLSKLGFAIGTANLCLIFYWLGSSRSTFYQLYTAETMVLFTTRWVTFKREKKHYYMLDFCYAANALLLGFLWLWPQCIWLHKALFAYNTGPLAWSIVVFQNSIVFHSVYEWTSLFVHWYPMLVTWSLRWDQDACDMYSTCDVTTAGWWEWTNLAERWSSNDLFYLAVMPMAPYFVWAALYYLKIFVLSSKRIEQRGYETLYKYMTTEHALCEKFMHRYPTRLQPLLYMACHSLLCWFSMAISVVFWYSPWAHTALVLITTASSIWNGANHYLEASIVIEESRKPSAARVKEKRR
ncbi:unnamed protein product [Ostreobium quekettii]|uniref:Glycerophosphocholine acyltransferase 1 n=1 Tax=Ostreobium quekettii TaxID=121088 RepID=A0A8S1IPW7_9CHLO|nr:unnamed protein product [Ostreobium quekettii]|eukprot:evm.model.scf_42.16 EVM.evm.TU.scf_42.16   scf_42:109997-113409(+)